LLTETNKTLQIKHNYESHTNQQGKGAHKRWLFSLTLVITLFNFWSKGTLC